MRVLLMYGGSRVGDTFHAIPLLKELKSKGIKCDWIHGSYEQEVCQLLKKLGLVDRLISTNFIVGRRGEAGVNPDMSSIKHFLTFIDEKEKDIFKLLEYKEPFYTYRNFSEYDAVITPSMRESDSGFDGFFTCNEDIGIDFNRCPWASGNIPNVIIDGYKRDGDYIGCQPASVSSFKTYSTLYSISFPGEVKSFGFEEEKPISNSFRIHGRSLEEVYEELQTCAMFVSTHSAIGLMAYYLNIPLIFISFWKNLARLAKRDNVIQLEEPEAIELEDVITQMYSKYVINKEVVNA